MADDMGRMAQQMLMQEGELLEEFRAAAATCVRRHALDDGEAQMFLQMIGLAP